MEMQERTQPLTEARDFGTLEIYLPVERHKQLHSLDPIVVSGKRAPLLYELVREIFDCVPQDLQRMPRLGSDVPAPVGSCKPG